MATVIKIEKLNLSARAYNICRANGLLNSKHIVLHYQKHGTFLRLRNCGNKTEEELISIANIYSNGLSPAISQEKPKNKVLKEPLEPIQKQLLSEYFKSRILSLDTRSKNAMTVIFERKNRDIEKVIEYFESIDFDYKEIKGIGEKSFSTLDTFWSDFIKEIKKIINRPQKEFLYELLVEKVMQKLNASEKVYDWLKEQIINYSKHEFPIIPFVKLALEDNAILNERSHYLLKFHSKYFLGFEKKRLQDSAKLFGLTRERIRQLCMREKLVHPLWEKLKEIIRIIQPKNISIEDLDNYGDDILMIDAEEINLNYDINFSSLFYYELYQLILKDRYTTIIETKDGYRKYLVKKEIAQIFNFQQLFNSIRDITKAKNEKDYFLNLKGLIFQSIDVDKLKKYSVDLVDIIRICEDILYEDFGLLTNMEGEIRIKRTSKKQVHEYIIEILEEANEPLHAEELYKRLEKKAANITRSAESLRAQLQHYRHLFINTAWSTYGLKKWEDEGRYIGGSIKDIVEIYLRKFDSPKHIYDIAQFVIQHRDTNKNNIYSNLQSDPEDRFNLFNYGFVGLTSIDYDENKTIFQSMFPMRYFEKNYFIGNKSIFSLDAIKKDFIKKYKVEESQFLIF